VPAYFTDAQRQATKDAGELAGFRVERILNEPTAAALAYGLDRLEEESLVVVYDLGGGTFDVSVLELFKGVLDVKAAAGNNRLGGADLDQRVAAWLAKELARVHGVDLAADRVACARLLAAAEQAKVQLSSAEVATVSLPFLFVKDGAPVSPELELTRARLEELIGDLVRSTLAPVEQALKDAKVTPQDVDAVVLVGGSSRIPLVHRVVAERFGKDPRRGVHPDEAVAMGAAVQAGLKSGALSAKAGGVMIADICPYTLGIEASTMAGSQRVDGVFSRIIRRNATIPVSRTEVYSTTGDGQTLVRIKVFQGDDDLVRNDVFLDQYEVAGIPPGPAGSERVAVTFTYDVNGILHVKTKIVSTGKEAALRVDRSAQRMTAPEREAARRRLEAEWSGGTSGPAPSSAAPAPAPEGAAPADELRQLAAAARGRAGDAPAPIAARLGKLAEALEGALAAGDAVAAARAGDELTELLFELG